MVNEKYEYKNGNAYQHYICLKDEQSNLLPKFYGFER